MKQVIVFPRGQLSAKDRRLLSRSGVVIVEADDPSKVVMMTPTPPLPADEMLAIALEAMSEGSGSQRFFVSKLAVALRQLANRRADNTTKEAPA